MPIADYRMYCRMIDHALEKGFAYPAINISSLTTANGVLKGLAESRSDGILQVSTGGAAFASGLHVKDMVLGAISIAEHVHRVAERYSVYVALHTDHCLARMLDRFVVPLIEETERRRASGRANLFGSHMFDGSDLPLAENLDTAVGLLERCHRNELILEVEAGVVGGEEDGIKGGGGEKLYTTPDDMVEVARRLNGVRGARYLLAATFGNVHGVYKPGQVKLKPSILRDGQEAVEKTFGKGTRLALVFHGGSGSTLEEIREAVDYGVVKMNIDTDTQYAFTRPIVDHMMKSYEGVLKIDGEVGHKEKYDPRTYMKLGEAALAERVKKAVSDLRGAGTTLYEGGR
ncbi:MAG: class II fructose-bisphosphate aldolase [bacterium]